MRRALRAWRRLRRRTPLVPGVLVAMCAAAAGCAGPRVDSQLVTAAGVEPPAIAAGAAPQPGEYPRPFDVRHYDIRLTLPDSGNQITGTTEIVLTASSRQDVLTLDFTGLAVVGVRVNDRPATFRHERGKLDVTLDRTELGQPLRVRVEYAGVPDDGLIIRNTVHGRRAVFADNWPNRARFWFPGIDHPADKATASFTIEAPAAWQVIANGVREPGSPEPPDSDSKTPASRRRWRWTIDEPISTYNMVVGAAGFDVRSVGTTCVTRDRCVEVSTWLFPQNSGTAAASFRRAVQMVEYYSGLIAPYPYRKLAHVQSATRFGGMENATAIFYDEQALAKGRDIESTVAHETAHQWFGNAVTAAEWRDLWLSEGFATYFGSLFFEHADGVERLRQRMEADRARVVRSETVTRAIVDTSDPDLFTLLNANTYQKGGWVLHMLRGLVGDAAFFEGVRQYYRRHEHGTATTADFQRAVEDASGRRLDWFFEQWVLEPGFPRFRATVRWDADGRAAEVLVEQTQSPSWPTFRMPLTVEVRSDEGSVRRTVELTSRRETVRLPLDGPPREVILDPDDWVLKDVERVDVLPPPGTARRP